MRGWLLTLSAAALAMVTSSPASSEMTFRSVSGDGTLTVDGGGNVVLDGHCFGNVGTLPAGPVFNIFGGKAVVVGGNLYVSGALNFSVASFPGAIAIRSGGSPVASISSDGSLYAAGTCANTRGYSNTKWDPERWNHTPQWRPGVHPGNCYTYSVDMQFADPEARCPGQTSVGPCPDTMTIHDYTDPGTGVTTKGLIERVEADGLIPVGPIYPDTPVAQPSTYDCARENRGHLVFMMVDPGSQLRPAIFADDYHFLRFDQENGSWSFKDGAGGCVVNDFVNQYSDRATCVMNNNVSSNPILNPLTFAVDSAGMVPPYDNFTVKIGFFCAPGGHANLH